MTDARVSVDPYVLDVLMPDLVGHDRQPTAFLVYLRLWRLTGGGTRASAEVSLRELSDQTGMSKRAIQEAVETLQRRKLIDLTRERPTAVPTYRVMRPWKR
jgi:DNA-binding GntR family transcriptional regulator